MGAKVVLTKKDLKTLVREYKQGVTLRELAHRWDYSLAVVRRLLVEGGADIRKPGQVAK